MIEASDEYMIAAVGCEVAATAGWSWHAAADGNGAWIVSPHPARLFIRNRAIRALTLAGRLAVGCGGDDPFVMSWRKGLFLVTGPLIRLTPTASRTGYHFTGALRRERVHADSMPTPDELRAFVGLRHLVAVSAA